MQKYEIYGHAPSLLPDNRKYKLVWQDEFDGGELDTKKWDYRLSMMGRRHPAWTDKGVHLDGNGNCVFTLIEEDGRPQSSQLQTGYNFMDEPTVPTTFGKDHLQWQIGKLKENKFTHKYGYYECRCRLQQKEGWWSAFWIQSPIIGASLDPAESGTELDVMECFHPGEIKPHNAFTGGYGLDMSCIKVGGFDLDEKEFHTFGLLWLPDKYVFYVDGVEDGVVEENVSAIDQFILISTECHGYRYENHRPTDEAVAAAKEGDTFVVDHVRVFDIKG